VALCVNPEETYLKVKAADGYTYYIAKALADKVLGSLAEEGKAAYEVLETYVGKDLEYKEYEPLYKCAGDAAEKQKKKAHFVTCDDYVTMTDGTGIVHIAPAFGEDDSRIGRNYELPFVQFVDGKGDLTAETPYAKDTPAALVYKATWPEEEAYICTVETLAQVAEEHGIKKTALVLVGDVITHGNYQKSRLYAADFTTEFRQAKCCHQLCAVTIVADHRIRQFRDGSGGGIPKGRSGIRHRLQDIYHCGAGDIVWDFFQLGVGVDPLGVTDVWNPCGVV
jgi:hypothetical protein